MDSCRHGERQPLIAGQVLRFVGVGHRVVACDQTQLPKADSAEFTAGPAGVAPSTSPNTTQTNAPPNCTLLERIKSTTARANSTAVTVTLIAPPPFGPPTSRGSPTDSSTERGCRSQTAKP